MSSQPLCAACAARITALGPGKHISTLRSAVFLGALLHTFILTLLHSNILRNHPSSAEQSYGWLWIALCIAIVPLGLFNFITKLYMLEDEKNETADENALTIAFIISIILGIIGVVATIIEGTNAKGRIAGMDALSSLRLGSWSMSCTMVLAILNEGGFRALNLEIMAAFENFFMHKEDPAAGGQWVYIAKSSLGDESGPVTGEV